MHKIITITFDEDARSPNTWDCAWRLVSFQRASKDYESPMRYLKTTATNDKVLKTQKLQDKAAKGLLFLLQYYSYISSRYDFVGEGPQSPHDTIRYGGVLIWDYPVRELFKKTYEDRMFDARHHLEWYNEWMNGGIYAFSVDEADRGRHIIAEDDCLQKDITNAILSEINPGDIITLTGKAAHVFDVDRLPPNVILVPSITQDKP